MDTILNVVKQIDAKKLKAGGAALVFVKLFGIGKTLFFLLGGVAGYLFATRYAGDKE